MLKTTALPILIASLTSAAFGQPASPQPAFEVATIKPAPPQERGRVSTRMSSTRGRLNYTNVSLSDVIQQAYGVQQNQISGPAWLDTERFDITAKIPEDVPKSQIPQMFQALLADRFKLKLHSERKELPVYELVVAKNGPKLVKVESSSGLGGHLGGVRAQVTGKVSMPRFADYLSERLGRPVLDQTKLEGSYTIDMEWVPDSAAQPGSDDAAGASGPSIFAALQEQLGLRLVATKGPIEVLIVDHAEKVPTGN